jgi:hypothetical protein
MNRKRVMAGTRLKVESIIFVDLICVKKINVSKLKDDKKDDSKYNEQMNLEKY